MNKKIFICCIIFMSVVLSNIFCETSITLKEDDFSGFDFKGYEPSSHTLEDESKSEIKENSIKEPYYAVGHSQGGVRVLEIGRAHV